MSENDSTQKIVTENFGLFEKFSFFHEKILKILKNHEKLMKNMKNHENHENHEKIDLFREIFEKNLKIMKNQKI